MLFMTKELYAEKMLQEIWDIISPLLTKYLELDYTWMVNPDTIYTMTGMDYIRGFFVFLVILSMVFFGIGYHFRGRKRLYLKGVGLFGNYIGYAFCIVVYPIFHRGLLPSKYTIQQIKRIWMEE